MIDAYVYDYKLGSNRIILKARTDQGRIHVPISYCRVGYIGRPVETDSYRILRDMLRIHGRSPLRHMRLPILEEGQCGRIEDIIPLDSSRVEPLILMYQINENPELSVRVLNMVGMIRTFRGPHALEEFYDHVSKIYPDMLVGVDSMSSMTSDKPLRRLFKDTVLVDIRRILSLLRDPLFDNEDIFMYMYEKIMTECSNPLFKIVDRIMEYTQYMCSRLPVILKGNLLGGALYRTRSLNGLLFVPHVSIVHRRWRFRTTYSCQHNVYCPEVTIIKFDRMIARTILQVLSLEPEYDFLTAHIKRIVEHQSDITDLLLTVVYRTLLYLPEQFYNKVNRLIEYKLQEVSRIIRYPILLIDVERVVMYIPFNKSVRTTINDKGRRVIDIDSTPIGDNFSIDIKDVASEHIDVRSLSYQYMSQEYYERLGALNGQLQRLEGIHIDRRFSQGGIVIGDKKCRQEFNFTDMSMIDYCTGDITSNPRSKMNPDVLATLTHGILKNNRLFIQ